jgi:hypothetical protein
VWGWHGGIGVTALYLLYCFTGNAIGLLVASHNKIALIREVMYVAVLRTKGFLEGYEVCSSKWANHLA